MKYTAIVSVHMWRDEKGDLEAEILSQLDNDTHTDIFCDLHHALTVQVEPEFDSSGECYFIAVVESEFVEYQHWDGIDYEVEHDITVLKTVEDLKTKVV